MSLKIQAVRAHDIEITPAMQDYIEKRLRKLEKILDPSDDSTSLEVEVGKEVPNQLRGNIFYVELRLHTAGNYFFARTQKEDMYDAIDSAEEEMMQELRKNKKKKETLLRRGGRRIKDLVSGFRRRS